MLVPSGQCTVAARLTPSPVRSALRANAMSAGIRTLQGRYSIPVVL